MSATAPDSSLRTIFTWRTASRTRHLVAALVLSLASPHVLDAQDATRFPADDPATAPPTEPSSGASASAAAAPSDVNTAMDIGDLWRHVRHTPKPLEESGAAQSARKPFFF